MMQPPVSLADAVAVGLALVMLLGWLFFWWNGRK